MYLCKIEKKLYLNLKYFKLRDFNFYKLKLFNIFYLPKDKHIKQKYMM